MTHHAIPITRVSDDVTPPSTSGVRRYPKGHPKGGKFVPKGEVINVNATQTVTATPARKELIAHKGFDKNCKTGQLACRGFNFKVGETYEHHRQPKACQHGFHACENPFHMFGYYGIRWDHGYGKVKMLGPFDKESDKIAAKGIEILEEYSWPHLLNVLAKFARENPDDYTVKQKVALNQKPDVMRPYSLRTMAGPNTPQISMYGVSIMMSNVANQLQIDQAGVPQMAFGDNSRQFGRGNWQVSHGNNIITTQYGGGRVEVLGKDSRAIIIDHSAYIRGVAGTKVIFALDNQYAPVSAVIGEGNLEPMTWLTMKDITPVVPRQYGLGPV